MASCTVRIRVMRSYSGPSNKMRDLHLQVLFKSTPGTLSHNHQIQLPSFASTVWGCHILCLSRGVKEILLSLIFDGPISVSAAPKAPKTLRTLNSESVRPVPHGRIT